MTWAELIVAVAVDSGLPKTKVAQVLRSFVKLSRLALMSGESVRLREFGLFYTIVSAKKVFGGTRKPTGRKIVRFKETRHGQVRRGARRREGEDVER